MSIVYCNEDAMRNFHFVVKTHFLVILQPECKVFSSAEIKEQLHIDVGTEDGECVCRRGISAIS